VSGASLPRSTDPNSFLKETGENVKLLVGRMDRLKIGPHRSDVEKR
jgi:hypothetical protein